MLKNKIVFALFMSINVINATDINEVERTAYTSAHLSYESQTKIRGLLEQHVSKLYRTMNGQGGYEHIKVTNPETWHVTLRSVDFNVDYKRLAKNDKITDRHNRNREEDVNAYHKAIQDIDNFAKKEWINFKNTDFKVSGLAILGGGYTDENGNRVPAHTRQQDGENYTRYYITLELSPLGGRDLTRFLPELSHVTIAKIDLPNRSKSKMSKELVELTGIFEEKIEKFRSKDVRLNFDRLGVTKDFKTVYTHF